MSVSWVYESSSARDELTFIDDEKHNTILVSNAIICRKKSHLICHPGSAFLDFIIFSRNNGNKRKKSKCLWRLQIHEFLQFDEENWKKIQKYLKKSRKAKKVAVQFLK